MFLFLLFLVGRAAMGPAPLSMTIVMDIFVIICPVLGIISLLYPFVLYPYFATREIVLSKEGIFFKCGFRPITIQKVTDLEARKFRGKEMILKITGLTPDGKEIHKRIARKGGGDVDKRWEEFKKDLQKIKSK